MPLNCDGIAPLKSRIRAVDGSNGISAHHHNVFLLLAAAAPTGSLSATEVTGCNIYKNGSDPPILPDAEYPEWLWKLATPGATLKELERKGPDNLDMDEVNIVWLGASLSTPPNHTSLFLCCL